MTKSIIVSLLLTMALHATTYVTQDGSYAFYEAKKDQFFSTHDIKAQNSDVTATITKEDTTYKGTLKINAATFTSDSDIRDAHVRDDYLHAKTHPFITYEFTIDANDISQGTLRVNGTDKKVTFNVTTTRKGEILTMTGKVKVKFSDFGIKTPANLILKAHDELVIGAHLLLKQVP